jgi:hypothetical protein
MSKLHAFASPRLALVSWLAAAPACGGAAGAGGVAPPGLDPVLARAKAASGADRWDRVESLAEESEVESGGLRGESDGLEELTTGRSVTRYTLGPVSGAEGHDGAQSWSQAPGGEVSVGSGPADRARAANSAWLTARAYWFPDRRPGRVERGPDREEGGRRFHTVRATPRGGRELVLWFDAGTGLLDRIVDDDGRITTTTTFADYRPVQGLVLPFSIRIGQGEARYDTAVRIRRYRVNPPAPVDRFAAPRGRFDDVTIAGGAGETTLPFELVNNHIYVDAKIDGKPVRLLVDTGGANVLSPSAAARLGLRAEGAMQGRGAGEKSQDVGFTRARSLRLGAVTIDRPVFYTIDLDPLVPVEGVPLAGLVGYEIFHRFAVRIDYAGRRLTLIDPRRFDPRAVKGESLPFTWNDQMPVVEGALDGVRGQFTIDTGSRGSLAVHAGFAERNGLAAKYGAPAARITGWGVGGAVRTRPARAGELALGRLRVRGVAADLAGAGKGAFADRHHAGNIGSGLLRRFTVTFDYARTRMILEPNRDFDAPDPFDRSGMWINGREGGFEVVEVVPDGPAARAGLAAGDLLLSLGGEPARFEDLARARQRLREQPAGTRVAVVYRRGGARRSATLVLADAIQPAR